MRADCAPLVSPMRGGKHPLYGYFNYGPAIGTAVLPKQPRLLTAAGHVNVEAVLMGSNTYEGTLFELNAAGCHADKDECLSYQEANQAVPHDGWDFKSVASVLWGEEAYISIATEYPANRYSDSMVPPNEIKINSGTSQSSETFRDFQQIAQAYGEAHYTCGTRRALAGVLNGAPKTTAYAYVFAHMCSLVNNMCPINGHTLNGLLGLVNSCPLNATHSSEHFFVIPGSSKEIKDTFTTEEHVLSLQMVSMWAHFVHGNDLESKNFAWPTWNHGEMLWRVASKGGPKVISAYYAWPGNPLEEGHQDTCLYWDQNWPGADR